MPLSWSGIRDDLARSTSTLQFQRHFRIIQAQHVVLGHYLDPPALLGALHGNQPDHASKNQILAALVTAAQNVGPASDPALTLLLLALWPGLDAVRNRCLRRRISVPDDVASDLLARVTELIRGLDLTRVNQIAATLLRNVERDLLRSVCRETARQQAGAPIEPDWIAAPPSWAEQIQMRAELRRDLAALIGEDADLVLGVALDGASQIEIGAALSLTESAARKRYQRATEKIRAHYAS